MAKKKYPVTCQRCGQTVMANHWAQKYCKECGIIVSIEKGKIRAHRAQEKKNRMKRRESAVSLENIASAAKAAGMTYGKYVARMGVR